MPLFDRLSGKQAFKIEITEVKDETGNGATGLSDVEILLKNNKNILTVLEENGDFRSSECIKLLKQSDIVVTNPPFSLFREYVAQLIEYKKRFIIVGNKNAFTYKEIFKLIKDNKMWSGYTPKIKRFQVPDYYNGKLISIEKDGKKYANNVGNVSWFTNLDVSYRHEYLILYKKYTPEEYPKYDNYDAININKTNEIPMDYDGVMGVPITFLDKYNPDQFEIIKFRKGNDDKDLSVNGKYPYFRILIKRKK